MILIQPPTVQNWNSLINKPSILSDNQISWDEIQNKPTTLAGYGITNGQPLGNELTALQNLSDSAGFLKKLGDGNYLIDNNNYLPLAGGTVTGVTNFSLGLSVRSQGFAPLQLINLAKTEAGLSTSYAFYNMKSTDAGGLGQNCFSIYTYTNGNVKSIPFVILDNDNVGIGTASPGFKTSIAQDLTMHPGDILAGQLAIHGNTNPTKRLLIGYDTNGNGFGFIEAGNHGVVWTNLALQPIGGNVGIGTTNPSQKLDVNGSAKATSFVVGTNQVVSARRTGWAAPTGTATRTTFATSTVTLPQLAERVKGLIDDLVAHGLIGA